jgi:hypothetical protein
MSLHDRIVLFPYAPYVCEFINHILRDSIMFLCDNALPRLHPAEVIRFSASITPLTMSTRVVDLDSDAPISLSSWSISYTH